MTETITKKITNGILQFISSNNIASVCCSDENKPHCFNCFYSVLEEEGCIVFKSSEDTKHIKILTKNNLIAGTIIAPDISLTKIEGIQFEGVNLEKNNIAFKAAKSYYLRYPFAITVPGKLWILELHSIKYTNTTNGIKNKLEWERNK